MTAWLNAHAKAIMASLFAALSLYWVVRQDGMTANEWLEVIATLAAGFGLTWAVPNTGITLPIPKTTTTSTVSATSPDNRDLATFRSEVAP
jgi:hypothetical protein